MSILLRNVASDIGMVLNLKLRRVILGLRLLSSSSNGDVQCIINRLQTQQIITLCLISSCRYVGATSNYFSQSLKAYGGAGLGCSIIPSSFGLASCSESRRQFSTSTRLWAATSRARGSSARPNGSTSRKSRKSGIKSKNSESVQKPASATSDSKKSIFLFGKFSQLHLPSKKVFESSSTGVDSIDSFDSLRIFPTVRYAMVEEIKSKYNLKSTYVSDKLGLKLKPSPVQIAAIRKINQPRTKNVSNETLTLGEQINQELILSNEANKLKVFTVAAETGSGKTWAYLSSLLSKLKEDDVANFNESPETYLKSKEFPIIRSVILVPTYELIEQVYETLKSANKMKYDLESMNIPKAYAEFLSLPDQQECLNLQVMKWGSGDPHTKIFNHCNQVGRIDVLVTTPAKITGLSKLTNYNRPFRFFNQVQYCVVDEADTLFDKSWFKDTTMVVSKLAKCRDLILCSATIPKEFEKTLSTLFPSKQSVINIVTPSLHKIPQSIAVKIIDSEVSPYNGSKTRALAQAIYAIHKDGTEQGYVKRIIIFVNEKKDVVPLVNSLTKKYGIRDDDLVGVVGSDSAKERLEKIEPFLHPAELVEKDVDQSKIKILVTTDLLARGLNFTGIKNVILMDLPRSSVDLVHRIGRTGRMRQSGRVFVIVDKKTRKSWIKGLPNAIKRGVILG
jgi:ATP-dependent RNA helicase MRH4